MFVLETINSIFLDIYQINYSENNVNNAAPLITEMPNANNTCNAVKANLMQNFSNFPNLNHNEEHFLNLDDEDNLYKPNESSNFFKLGNIPDLDTKNLMKLNQMQESYPKFMNDQRQKENM